MAVQSKIAKNKKSYFTFWNDEILNLGVRLYANDEGGKRSDWLLNFSRDSPLPRGNDANETTPPKKYNLVLVYTRNERIQ